MEYLIIRLGTKPIQPVHWIVWSTDQGDTIASGELADAHQLYTLKERAGRRHVITLVPSSDVLLKWVPLPPKANQKILSAIPYMVEDDIATDVSNHFFAYGPKNNNQQAIAVIDRDKIIAWKETLQNAGLHCTHMIPDVLAVPEHKSGLSLLTIDNDWIIRQNDFEGVQGEKDWILGYLELYAKRQDLPLSILNFSTQELNHIPHTETERALLEPPMQVLAKSALSVKFNLLQGEFKSRKNDNKIWKKWRTVAILAALVLATSLIDDLVKLQSYQSKNQTISTQISNTVKKAFPKIGSYRDVRAKVKSELKKMQFGGSGISMTNMLHELSNAFLQSGIKPKSLRFDGKRAELRIQAEGDNFDSLETFKRLAESNGFTVEQGAINNRDNKVVSSMTIRSQS